MVLQKHVFWRKKHSPVRRLLYYDQKDYDATFDVPWFVQKWVGLRLTRKDPAHVRLLWDIYYWLEHINLWVAAVLEIIYMAVKSTQYVEIFLSMPCMCNLLLDGFSSRIFWDVFYWFEHLNFWVAIVLDILYMVFKSTQYVEIFLMAPCIGYLLLAIFKSYKMVIYRPVFNNLVSELRDMWPQGTVSDEEDHIIRTTLRKLNMVVKGYYWCNVALVVIFLSPSFVALIYRAAGYDTSLILPYLYWYPFDPYEGGPCYAFALMFEDFHGVTAICFMVMGDLLFCIFLSHISIQFDLLSYRIRRLVPKKEPDHGLGAFTIQQMRTESCDSPEWDKTLLKKLAAIIVRHRALIRLSGDVENMFSGALLLNFLNSSMIFCFCGFCAVIVEKWNEFSYKSFLVTALAQTYLLCSHGQLLINSSKGISEALYSCLWYNSSKKVKSSVLIMIHRSQKEIHVTTYGFSVINMASYATILKTSWSYLSLLLNVYK